MAKEQQRLSPDERANLVAYLDGELPEHDAQVITTKLTHSQTARRELESLQKTWELLDHLPLPRAPENFTERTLGEIARIESRGGQLETVLRRGGRRMMILSLWVAVSMIAFLATFAAVRWAWPNPSERLARELPIAEHLDEYRDVGTFDFLNELYNSPEFGTSPTD